MGLKEDFVGQCFGRWRVIAVAPAKNRRFHWLCECQCGKKTRRIMDTNTLRMGRTYSCGCAAKENYVKQRRKEGVY